MISGGRRSPAERLAAGEPLRALLVKLPAPAEIELAGHTGFDAVILDGEHGPLDETVLEHHLRAADAAAVPALVRVPGADPAAILAALDGGACGVVVPHVSDPATAAAIVAAARYPPRGRRGLALTTRAGRYGQRPLEEHLRRAAAQTLVVVQIEDAEAVERTREILGVDGVDAVLIGATDLSISLGHPGELEHPTVQAAIDTILAGAAETGVVAATVVAGRAQALRDQRRGALLSVFVATQLIATAFAGAVTGGPDTAEGGQPAATQAPLVLIPGMLATAALWDTVATSLAERDGHAVRAARIDLDDSVAEMAATVLAGAPRRFALAGHSLGGIVALEIVRRAPHRVTRLALLNSSARPPTERQLTAWAAHRKALDGGGFVRLCEELARANLPDSRRDEAQLIAAQTSMAGDVGAVGLDRQLTAQATRPDGRPTLAQITCPTLVICAEQDEVCPPALQEELAALTPTARLVRFAGCGHISPLEAPEEVTAALAQWLQT